MDSDGYGSTESFSTEAEYVTDPAHDDHIGLHYLAQVFLREVRQY